MLFMLNLAFLFGAWPPRGIRWMRRLLNYNKLYALHIIISYWFTKDKILMITVSVSVNLYLYQNIFFREFDIIRGHDVCQWPSVQLAAKRSYHLHGTSPITLILYSCALCWCCAIAYSNYYKRLYHQYPNQAKV